MGSSSLWKASELHPPSLPPSLSPLNSCTAGPIISCYRFIPSLDQLLLKGCHGYQLDQIV